MKKFIVRFICAVVWIGSLLAVSGLLIGPHSERMTRYLALKKTFEETLHPTEDAYTHAVFENIEIKDASDDACAKFLCRFYVYQDELEVPDSQKLSSFRAVDSSIGKSTLYELWKFPKLQKVVLENCAEIDDEFIAPLREKGVEVSIINSAAASNESEADNE